MAKFERASEDVVTLFNGIKAKTAIPQWLEFEILCSNKQKMLYKIVKLNDLVETLTSIISDSPGVNFAVVFNEEILDQMPDDQKEMAIIECLAGVSVSETDAVTLEKPNFSTYRGVLEKYGHDPIIVLHESIKSLFDKQKQKEDEEKAARKGKRGKKFNK
jgi:hypothetical protein